MDLIDSASAKNYSLEIANRFMRHEAVTDNDTRFTFLDEKEYWQLDNTYNLEKCKKGNECLDSKKMSKGFESGVVNDAFPLFEKAFRRITRGVLGRIAKSVKEQEWEAGRQKVDKVCRRKVRTRRINLKTRTADLSVGEFKGKLSLYDVDENGTTDVLKLNGQFNGTKYDLTIGALTLVKDELQNCWTATKTSDEVYTGYLKQFDKKIEKPAVQ